MVVTVPAYFGMLEKDATKNAGKIAGLDVIGIVPEPVAAALHYEARTTEAENKTILVYDLGGGTFDTTVIRRCAAGRRCHEDACGRAAAAHRVRLGTQAARSRPRGSQARRCMHWAGSCTASCRPPMTWLAPRTRPGRGHCARNWQQTVADNNLSIATIAARWRLAPITGTRSARSQRSRSPSGVVDLTSVCPRYGIFGRHQRAALLCAAAHCWRMCSRI